jgi:hypothetical protein
MVHYCSKLVNKNCEEIFCQRKKKGSRRAGEGDVVCGRVKKERERERVRL